MLMNHSSHARTYALSTAWQQTHKALPLVMTQCLFSKHCFPTPSSSVTSPSMNVYEWKWNEWRHFFRNLFSPNPCHPILEQMSTTLDQNHSDKLKKRVPTKRGEKNQELNKKEKRLKSYFFRCRWRHTKSGFFFSTNHFFRSSMIFVFKPSLAQMFLTWANMLNLTCSIGGDVIFCI